MAESKLVGSLDDLLVNIEYLEGIRRNSKGPDYDEYKGYIRRGVHFLAYPHSEGFAFAPSRFVGYKENDFKKHYDSDNKHGGHTNSSINEIIGYESEKFEILEHKFEKICSSLGDEPNKKDKKYWYFPVNDQHNVNQEKILEVLGNVDETLKTVTESVVKIRVGQEKFRKKLLKLWGEKCCVTGCTHEPVLRASHIKPWSASDDGERLDKFNGLLLSPNFDSLFDLGFISFEKDGSIMISTKLNESNLRLLGCALDQKINLKPENEKYLKFHRQKVFQK